MKILIALLLTLSSVPVSILSMVYGWGLQAENWGWVAFSYLWIMLMPVLTSQLGARE